MSEIELRAGAETLILECLNTPTAAAILEALPISSTARTWGEEVYFPVPVSVEKEDNARDVVKAGEIAFWVEGSCIAIGFGPTPISASGEIRLAAETNIWAKSKTDVRCLKAVQSGDPIRLKKRGKS